MVGNDIKNPPEHEKQRLAEYRKKYEIWKNKTVSQIKREKEFSRERKNFLHFFFKVC